MATNEFPIFDGVAPSWADLVCKFQKSGLPLLEMKDIKEINTGATLEIGEQRAGGRVVRRTTGSLSTECSVALYRVGYQKLLRNLKAAAPLVGNQRIISRVVFNIQFQFSIDDEDDVYETRIKGCRLTGRDINTAEGTDALVVPVKLSTIQIADVVDGEEIVYG